jgi:16S rRNA (guanine966-N2)-methyltransferase
MRIISGKLRGRILKGPRGMELRPTGDRLKETLFNILGSRIHGAIFMDVFAGTGSIGIEAISRGADEVLFIESNPDAVRLIRNNLESCGIRAGFRLIAQDVFATLRQLGRQEVPADIVFFDPPYRFVPYGDLLDIMFRMNIASGDALCVIEHHAKAEVPEGGPGYRRFRVVKQGDTRLSFFRGDAVKENDPPPDADGR